MSRPTRQQVHPVDQLLTNMAIGYTQSRERNFARRIFPVVPVTDQGGKYPIFSKDDFLRDWAKRRAPGTAAEEAGYDITTGTYYCEEWALAHKVPIEISRNMQGPLSAEQGAVQFLVNAMLIREDMLWAEAFFATGQWGTDLTGVSGSPNAGEFKQFDQSGSDPIGVLRTAIQTIDKNIGRHPNVLVIGPEVWKTLCDHTDLIERIGTHTTQIVTEDLVARLFGLEEVVVAKSIRNTAKQGQTFSGSYNLGKHMLLAYRSKNPSANVMDLEPNAGFVMSWAGMDGMAAAAQVGAPSIDRWWEERIKSDVFRASSFTDMKVTTAEAGYFFSGCVA